MKNLRLTIAICLVILTSSCVLGRRHTTIFENGDGHQMRIEYRGDATFTRDSTAIQSISTYGYIKYCRDDQKLEAKSDGGENITYKINDRDEQKNLNAADKQFVATAVRYIMRAGHSSN